MEKSTISKDDYDLLLRLSKSKGMWPKVTSQGKYRVLLNFDSMNEVEEFEFNIQTLAKKNNNLYISDDLPVDIDQRLKSIYNYIFDMYFK